MIKLNQQQRAQARRDLQSIQLTQQKIQKISYVPEEIKNGWDAQLRLLDTLAIAAGVFQEGDD